MSLGTRNGKNGTPKKANQSSFALICEPIDTTLTRQCSSYVCCPCLPTRRSGGAVEWTRGQVPILCRPLVVDTRPRHRPCCRRSCTRTRSRCTRRQKTRRRRVVAGGWGRPGRCRWRASAVWDTPPVGRTLRKCKVRANGRLGGFYNSHSRPGWEDRPRCHLVH